MTTRTPTAIRGTLTPAHIAELRARAEAETRQRRATPSVWFTVAGGPLNAMRLALAPTDSMFIAWTVMTNRGCVQCMYRREGTGLRFEEVV